jgi:hypothetical protein
LIFEGFEAPKNQEKTWLPDKNKKSGMVFWLPKITLKYGKKVIGSQI